MFETIERASGWVVARKDDNLSRAALPCLHKDGVLRLRFASPQNLDPRTLALLKEQDVQ